MKISTLSAKVHADNDRISHAGSLWDGCSMWVWTLCVCVCVHLSLQANNWTSLNDEELNVHGRPLRKDYSMLPNTRGGQRTETEGGDKPESCDRIRPINYWICWRYDKWRCPSPHRCLWLLQGQLDRVSAFLLLNHVRRFKTLCCFFFFFFSAHLQCGWSLDK